MFKVYAHDREWCSVSLLLEGHSDAQPQFLRWLKKSEFLRLEVTGAALAPLRKAQVIKARAPIGTLVTVEDLATIAQAYNARGPKYKVENALNEVVWKGTLVLEGAPRVKIGKQTSGEAGTKKAKFDGAPTQEAEDVLGQGGEDAWLGSSLWLGFLSDHEQQGDERAPIPWGLAHSCSVTEAMELDDAAPMGPWSTDPFNSHPFDGPFMPLGDRYWLTGSLGD